MLNVWKKAVTVSCLVLGLSGCGVKEYLNCRDICNTKQRCGTDTNYNVQNCVDQCSTDANNSSDYSRQVDTCKECVNGLACNDPKFAACFVNCPKLP